MSRTDAARPRRAAVAVAAGLLAIAATVSGTVLVIAAPDDAVRELGAYWTLGTVGVASVIALNACLALIVAVGAVIAARLPNQPVGWLLLAGGSAMALGQFGEGYAVHAVASEPLALPGATLLTWIGNFIWGPALAALAAALLVFPSGRAVSEAWSRAWRVVLAGTGIVTAVFALAPGPLPLMPGIQNPFAAVPVGTIPRVVLELGFGMCVAAMVVLPAGSMFVRYRRSSPIEQAQLRWVAAAACLFAFTVLTMVALGGTWDSSSDALFFASLATIPTAIGVAILRYRLYAIDVIIRRTLVYGALTATLGVCYLAAVVVLQALVAPFTRQDTLAVAAATLLVAAGFRPLRSRLQQAIDRRFYRVRYDAARATGALAARLGHAVDLDVIEADLLGTVVETVHPERVGLWLRTSHTRSTRLQR